MMNSQDTTTSFESSTLGKQKTDPTSDPTGALTQVMSTSTEGATLSTAQEMTFSTKSTESFPNSVEHSTLGQEYSVDYSTVSHQGSTETNMPSPNGFILIINFIKNIKVLIYKTNNTRH